MNIKKLSMGNKFSSRRIKDGYEDDWRTYAKQAVDLAMEVLNGTNPYRSEAKEEIRRLDQKANRILKDKYRKFEERRLFPQITTYCSDYDGYYQIGRFPELGLSSSIDFGHFSISIWFEKGKVNKTGDGYAYQELYEDFEEYFESLQGSANALSISDSRRVSDSLKDDYEEYLNEIGENLDEDEFIIGGRRRNMPYGTALRRYDKVAFNVGFDEWMLENGDEYGEDEDW